MPFLKENKYGLSRSRKLENLSLKNGLRKTLFNTVGDRYVGEWKDNQKSGKGALLTRNGELYEGDFERNYRHGFGVLSHRLPDCNVFTLDYRGEWKNGRMHGQGVRIYPNGSFYVGNFKNGKRHGYGQEYSAEHDFYDGDWYNDVKHGLGMFVRSDGNRFEGTWMFGKKNGLGILFHLDSGQLQEGYWVDDNCVTSKICDITYRQAAAHPTKYPIKPAAYIGATVEDPTQPTIVYQDAKQLMEDKKESSIKFNSVYISEKVSRGSVLSRKDS